MYNKQDGIFGTHTPLESIEAAKDVTITVELPDFLQQVRAFEATADGLKPFGACTVANGKAVLKLDAIESGRVFVLRRR